MSRLFWKRVWDGKGHSDSSDLLFLDGYEHLNIEFDSKQICDKIVRLIGVKDNESILEVGCGAGFLARELQKYEYVGVDYSRPIINKHKTLFPGHKVLVAEANRLPFESKSYDNVFCFGLFQYLPNKKYADEVLSEMRRVARKVVFLGDLKREKTREEHFVSPAPDLQRQGFNISSCVYDCDDVERFNALERCYDLE